jgi:hypothetical protein
LYQSTRAATWPIEHWPGGGRGRGGISGRTRGRQADADAYIMKPYNPSGPCTKLKGMPVGGGQVTAAAASA